MTDSADDAMVEDSATEQPPADAAEVVQDDQPAEDSAEDEQEPEPQTANEAAKFRRRLRETEKERDELAARVEALQRRRVETLLASTGVKPAAVFSVADLAALVDDDGTVNADKVTEAVNTARERFNIAPIGKGVHVPGVGNQPSIKPKADAFTDAFKPSRPR